MISYKNKFIFIHTPKTAGTSIMKALNNCNIIGEGHHTLQEIIRLNNLRSCDLKNFFKFSVVRNPWSLAVSNYHYSKAHKSYWHSRDGSTKYGQHPDYDFAKNSNFDSYIDALIQGKLKHKYSMIQQVHWIDERLDFVLRYENLEEDFKKVCQHLSLTDINLPRINSSKHDHYSLYYSDFSKNAVKSYFLKDIEKFGYKFEQK